LAEAAPAVRAGWSRAVARAEGSARSGLSRFGWAHVIEQVNDELPDGLG